MNRSPRVWIAVFAVVVTWILALLQWGQPLHWDELEFFRATRWVAEGRVPFRDFWEHHLPLQWLLFSPAAAVFSAGPGTQSVLALRWAQLPLWFVVFVLVMRLMRCSGIDRTARWAAMTMLLSSFWFIRTALQYRVDVPGHAAYLGGLCLLTERRGWPCSFGAGSLLSLAVLANIRLAPLVVFTTVLMFFWRADEEKWSWNGSALHVVLGGGAVAAMFIVYLRFSGAMSGFTEGVLWYNPASDRLVPPGVSSFGARLAGPLIERDAAGGLFLVVASIGVALALWRAGRPATLVISSVLGVASLAMVAMLSAEYDYHFHTALLLLLPAAAYCIARIPQRLALLLPLIAIVSVLTSILAALPDWGANLQYQNLLMVEVDRRTAPHERVWDATGYALRREPAYRYWFLPAGVRLMADRGLIEPYDIDQMVADPPGAIMFNDRIRWWMLGRPRLAEYVAHHFVPLHQHLWLPGMSAAVGPGPWRTSWRVPKSGRYEAYVSELLAVHPWFDRWSDYGLLRGTELAIPLEHVPQVAAESLEWQLDGVRMSFPRELEAGQHLALHSALPRRAGVFIVPHDIETLSLMPQAAKPFF